MGRKNKTKILKNNSSFNASSLDESRLSQNQQSPSEKENDAVVINDEVKMELMTVFGNSRMENFHEKFRIVLLELEKKNAELECAKKLINSLKKEDIERLKEDANDAKLKSQELADRVITLELSKNEAITQIRNLKNKLIEKDDMCKQAEQETAKFHNEIHKTRFEVENARAAIIDLEKRMEATNLILQKTQEFSKNEKLEMEKVLEDERRKYAEVQKEFHESTKRIDNYKLQNEQLAEEVKKLNQNSTSLEMKCAQLEELNARLSESFKESELSTDTISKLEAELAAMKRVSEGEKNEREDLRTKWMNEKAKLDDVQKKYEHEFDKINCDVQFIKKEFDLVKLNLEKTKQDNHLLMEKERTMRDNANNEIASLQNLLKKTQDKLVNECDSKEATIKSLQDELTVAKSNNAKSLEELEYKNKRLRADLKTAENKKSVLLAGNVKLKEQVKHLEEQLGSSMSLLEEKKKEMESDEGKINDLKSVLNLKEIALAEATNKIDELKKQFDDAKLKETDLLKKLSSSKSDVQKIEKLETRMEELKRSSENQQKRANSELASARQRLLVVEEEKSKLEVLLDTESAKVVDISKKRDDDMKKFNSSIMEAQQKLEKLESEKVDFGKKLHESSKTIENLEITLKQFHDNQAKLKERDTCIQKLEELLTAEKEKLHELEVTHSNEVSVLRKSCDESKKMETKLIEMERKMKMVDENTADIESKLKIELQDAQSRLQEAEKAIAEKNIECQRLLTEVTKSEELQKSVNSQNNGIESELTATKLKLEEAEQLVKNLKEEIARIVELESKKTEVLVKVADDEKKALEKTVSDLKLKLEETAKADKEQKAESKRLIEAESWKTKKAYKMVEQVKKEMTETVDKLNKCISQKNSELEELKKNSDRSSELEKLQKSIGNLEEELSLAREENVKIQKLEIEMKKQYEIESTKAKEFEMKSTVLFEKLEVAKGELEKVGQIGKAERDRIAQLELRLETLQGSAAFQQKRFEEELGSTRTKLEKCENLLAEKTAECQKLAELESRVQQLQSISDIQNKLENDIQSLNYKLELSEKEKRSLNNKIVELESQIQHLKTEHSDEMETAERKLKEYDDLMLQKMDGDEGSKESERSTPTSTIVEVEQRNKEAIVNLSSETAYSENSNNLLEWVKKSTVSVLESSSHPMARQLSRRIQMMRYNSSFAIYPYIRYILAVYVILLHIWLVFSVIF